MKVDIQTLETFNRFAHAGAQTAAESLEGVAGTSPTVEATAMNLATEQDVLADFRDRDLVGVTMDFKGAFEGTALLVFDDVDARTLGEKLPGTDPDGMEAVHPAVDEVGSLVITGFIDELANHLQTTIDVSEPNRVSGSGTSVLPELDGTDTEHFLVFNSLLEVSDAELRASVYLFPEQESFEEILVEQLAEQPAPIPLDKLQTFNRMTAIGTEQASENVTMMTGSETAVEVSRLSFLPIEQTATRLNDDLYVGVVVGLEGLPSGYLLILFEESSAKAVATQLGAGADEDGFTEMHRSAIEEISNIMCSGFIDGWANVLDTTITHTPPEFVYDYASAIIDPVITQLATQQQYVFVFDSRIKTVDDTVSCEILALPNESDMKQALSSLDIDAAPDANSDPLAEAMEANPEELF